MRQLSSMKQAQAEEEKKSIPVVSMITSGDSCGNNLFQKVISIVVEVQKKVKWDVGKLSS